jgi:phosphoribosylaminoimidazolecarboxamide formyltransferase/IMP cyclohydrolase
MRALVSVFDKTGIVEFCRKLQELNIEIISTGGTGQLLKESNIPFIPVENITRNKEAFGGRMKTISFEMSSSILYRRGHPEDEKQREDLGIDPIDLVVCNLYAFHTAVEKKSPLLELIELIDIGGPMMIRAAAKNYLDVGCVTDPLDYEMITNELLNNKKLSLKTKEYLSLKAFTLTAQYDLSIQNELNKRFQHSTEIQFSKDEVSLRYGENPHQKAKISKLNLTHHENTLANAPILQGKEISYNNYLDSDVAFKCVSELKLISPHLKSVVIVKHGTPCGIAQSDDLFKSLEAAWDCDSISAFGGIISFSDTVTSKEAHFFKEKFIELIIAPKFDDEARKIFALKKNVRLLEVPLKEKNASEKTVRSINGGLLIQDEDEKLSSEIDYNQKSIKGFESHPKELLYFGQTIIKYLKSNCLALVRMENNVFKITSSGVGQPNRLHCLSLLIKNKTMGLDLSRDILFSDAFFPFSDSIQEAHKLGIKYIIEPGGSIKDNEVIAACDELNIALAFTGVRHFRH